MKMLRQRWCRLKKTKTKPKNTLILFSEHTLSPPFLCLSACPSLPSHLSLCLFYSLCPGATAVLSPFSLFLCLPYSSSTSPLLPKPIASSFPLPILYILLMYTGAAGHGHFCFLSFLRHLIALPFVDAICQLSGSLQILYAIRMLTLKNIS